MTLRARGRQDSLVQRASMMLLAVYKERQRALRLHERYMDLLDHDGWAVCGCPTAQVIRALGNIDWPHRITRKEPRK